LGSVTSVDERNSQTIYKGDEIIEVLTTRNFIIESETVNVNFVMRKESQAGEGTIVVEENATGVSFNSIKRTHVEWTMTSLNGQPYYKIKVLEPKGLVKRATPTIVYINLWRDSRVPVGKSVAPYNIILRTGRSVVAFDGDPVDPNNPEMMHINTLQIDNAAGVYLPTTPANPAGEFTVDIENIILNGNGITFDGRCLVKDSVKLKGHNGKYTLAAVDGTVDVSGGNSIISVTGNMGRLGIHGDNNVVSVAGNVTEQLGWNAPNGGLTVSGQCGSLNVTTENARMDINSVVGNVYMETISGNLHINEVTVGGLVFTVKNNGLASINVGRVNGAVGIPEMGLGSVYITNVCGDVFITSDKKNAGPVTVSFDPEIDTNPSVRIIGYDGKITVSNIRGTTDISVRDALPEGGKGAGTGLANIDAHFMRVDEDVNITANMGYVNGHKDTANVTVRLNEPTCAVLTVVGTSVAEIKNSAQPYIPNTGNSGQNKVFYLYDRTTITTPLVDENTFWAIIEGVLGEPVVRSHITVKTSTIFTML
jgi:hypothetical protein